MNKIIREAPNSFDLPYRIKRLADLAHNLWWVGNPEAARLFREIDLLTWEQCTHNPIVFLRKVDRQIFDDLIKDRYFLERYDRIMREFDAYMHKDDTWFKESVLHEDGELDDVLELMKDKGLTFEKDGALWYKATEHGGEKDEVLVRANGTPTYFAADIAYHRNKFEKRGFDKCIDVWGADHHGHVARLKGALNAIGVRGDDLDIVLMQLVRLT